MWGGDGMMMVSTMVCDLFTCLPVLVLITYIFFLYFVNTIIDHLLYGKEFSKNFRSTPLKIF